MSVSIKQQLLHAFEREAEDHLRKYQSAMCVVRDLRDRDSDDLPPSYVAAARARGIVDTTTHAELPFESQPS